MANDDKTEKTDPKAAPSSAASRSTSASAAPEKPTAKTRTVAMTHATSGATWEAQTVAEVREMQVNGWKLDDPAQDFSKVPSGSIGPGRGTPTGSAN